MKKYIFRRIFGNFLAARISAQIHSSCLVQNDSNARLDQHQKKVMGRGLPKKTEIKGVKNIVLVASGKGGVGKTTTAVNVATAMKVIHPEKEIGILDTDVFGPSVPLMMNLCETPLLNDKNLMVPLLNYGVHCMSMGFLIDEKAPVIWRGLKVMQALETLLKQVAWPNIDCLVVDTPPGTGDTLLSLVQNVPIQGVLLITTPQSASLQVTRRGATMFQKLSVPIIGIVENMSSVICPSCSNDVRLFGNGTDKLAADIGSKIIISVPLQQGISSSTDKGIPIVIENPDCSESRSYKSLAQTVLQFLGK